VAKSFARIHRRNLINFGVLPLLFCDGGDADAIEQLDILRMAAPLQQLAAGQPIELIDQTAQRSFWLKQDITPEELATLQAGGLINRVRQKLNAAGRAA
jgi:aconitase A